MLLYIVIFSEKLFNLLWNYSTKAKLKKVGQLGADHKRIIYKQKIIFGFSNSRVVIYITE